MRCLSHNCAPLTLNLIKVMTIKVSNAPKPKFSFAAISDEGENSSKGWSNPFASSADEARAGTNGTGATTGGGSLLAGEYDEAAEAEAFKRAVEEWRNPGAAKASRRSNNADSEEGTGTDYGDLSKSSAVAKNLAEKMELDFKKKKQELQERRKSAEIAMKER